MAGKSHKTVHTQHLGGNAYRDIDVYYEKGSMNYWDYSRKTCGIYIRVTRYTKSGGIRSWSTGQKGDGYLQIIPLERYRRSAYTGVCARVEANIDTVLRLLDERTLEAIEELRALLSGAAQPEAIAA